VLKLASGFLSLGRIPGRSPNADVCAGRNECSCFPGPAWVARPLQGTKSLNVGAEKFPPHRPDAAGHPPGSQYVPNFFTIGLCGEKPLFRSSLSCSELNYDETVQALRHVLVHEVPVGDVPERFQ